MSRQVHGPRTLPKRRRVYHRCSCGRSIPEGVSRCSARTCPEFAPIWARDTRRRLLENLRIVPLTVMFSVTAPGADQYPFDPRVCSHRPVHRCSGLAGCRVDPELARAFNQLATGQKQALLARVWEKQKRGLAHLHGVVAVSTPAERAWAEVYVTALREMAPRKGFGFVDGWQKIGRKFWPGDQAGAYLSSYFASGRGHKASITENVFAGDLPRLVVFVSRALTQRTHCTMRNLRDARRLWAIVQGLTEAPARWTDWDRLVLACLRSRFPVPIRAP
jgi:hypothetical protein